MKDQRLLLRKCQSNGIPAVVFQGTDPCAAGILRSAEEIYKKSGCIMEFLYDFDKLAKDFEVYSNENKRELAVPALEEYTDKQILNEAIYNDVPVVVFQGTDSCVSDILSSARDIYRQSGCMPEFLTGFESYINTFVEYKNAHTGSMKLPSLSESEKAFVREDMDFDFMSAVETGDTMRQREMAGTGYQPSDELLLTAMKKDPSVIDNFSNLSERVQLAAVHDSAYAVQGIRCPTDKVLITAIRKCPEVFELIDNPSDTVKMEAVRLRPDNLRFIEEPSKEIIEAAVYLDPYTCRYCENITDSMYEDIIEPCLSFKDAIEQNEFSSLVGLKESGYQPSSGLIRLICGTFSESASVAVQKIFGMEVFASSNVQLKIDMFSDSIPAARPVAIEQNI